MKTKMRGLFENPMPEGVKSTKGQGLGLKKENLNDSHQVRTNFTAAAYLISHFSGRLTSWLHHAQSPRSEFLRGLGCFFPKRTPTYPPPQWQADFMATPCTIPQIRVF